MASPSAGSRHQGHRSTMLNMLEPKCINYTGCIISEGRRGGETEETTPRKSCQRRRKPIALHANLFQIGREAVPESVIAAKKDVLVSIKWTRGIRKSRTGSLSEAWVGL